LDGWPSQNRGDQAKIKIGAMSVQTNDDRITIDLLFGERKMHKYFPSNRLKLSLNIDFHKLSISNNKTKPSDQLIVSPADHRIKEGIASCWN